MSSVNAFGYAYSLTIGISESLVKVAVPASLSREPVATAEDPTTPEKLLDIAGIINEAFLGTDTSETADFRTIPGKFFEIVDRQLEVEVDNTKDTTNPCSISIYNLTDDQLQLVKANSTVILRAGYKTDIAGSGKSEKDLPLVYIGQVVSKTTTDDGTNRVTRLICSDGRTPLKNIKISMSWSPGTTYQDIILDLLDISAQAGIPLGRFTGDSEGVTPLQDEVEDGYTVSGLLGQEMAKLFDSIQYRMYMVLGKLYIEPLYVTPTVEVVNISSENIKGTINEEEDDSSSMSGTPEEKVGITLKTYLNGNISVNKYLRLSNLLNSKFEGDYKIVSTRHSMNYEGDVWETEINATRIG